MSERNAEQDARIESNVHQPTGNDFFAEPPRRLRRRDDLDKDSDSTERAREEADADPRTIEPGDRCSEIEWPGE